MKEFKRHKGYGFWDQNLRLSKLSKLGDPLERLNNGIDFEIFRDLLESRLFKLSKAPGGRPPYDYVLMFKILILQRYYNLSDDQIEFQINDRLSFMRFLDLTISDDIPDSRTVWNFREQITDLGLVEDLFALFIEQLETLGLIINEGKIIDASFVEVPRQRNKKSENDQIKEGNGAELWNDNHRKILGILKAIKQLPSEPQKTLNSEKGTNVTINNSQQNTQNNTQEVVFNIFVEAFQDELTGKEMKELKEILSDFVKEPEKTKSRLLDKLKNFGRNVLSNIVANIITNPIVYSSLQ